MKTFELTAEDILSVADRIHIELTDEEIQLIKSTHETAQEDDPSATWDLVVENQIYMIEYDKEPKGPFNQLGYEQTAEPDRYHTDGDGGDDVNLNFLG
jgi:hypothetical protein